MTSGQLKLGDIVTRADMKAMFGGGKQGGIIPSETTRNILIYADHESGKRYGYEDGWLAEEDAKGPLFEYTGQGVQGDQTLTDRNKSVALHGEHGRILRVFVCVGYVNGKSGTKKHRYLGEFKLDDNEPFVRRRALDEKQAMRWVYVFRLRPVAEAEQRAEDFVAAASVNSVETVSTAPISDPTLLELRIAQATQGQVAKPESHGQTKATRKASDAVEITRREAELSDRFLAFLEGKGHQVRRFKIRIKGLTSTFWTDLYDMTDNVLYELKGNSGRGAVRMAIGQLLDYSRHLPQKDVQLVVLLPEKPIDDLAQLVEHAGMEFIYEEGDTFVGWSAG
ncbi:hypothetical protein [Streptomyces sp. NPDC054784]